MLDHNEERQFRIVPRVIDFHWRLQKNFSLVFRNINSINETIKMTSIGRKSSPICFRQVIGAKIVRQ